MHIQRCTDLFRLLQFYEHIRGVKSGHGTDYCILPWGFYKTTNLALFSLRFNKIMLFQWSVISLNKNKYLFFLQHVSNEGVGCSGTTTKVIILKIMLKNKLVLNFVIVHYHKLYQKVRLIKSEKISHSQHFIFYMIASRNRGLWSKWF